MTTHVDYSYSTDSTDNYKTSFSNLFSSVSNKQSFKFSSKSPTIRSATETPITNTEHPSTVYDKTVTEITDTAIISAITTEKSTQGPVSIVSTSKASDRIPNEFCLCPCSSTKKPSNEPFSINNMRLNKKTLSSYRRTLTSATDQRFSVLLIGWSGVFVLVMAVLMIIIPDILTLVKVIRKRKSKSKVAGIS
ncbi:unnamed protein product [Mytilus edulis]|uniref:Uncharacterized protein n=1 Tax=Mytilus edulis TaxID=6550 RepID=A0A8S3T189_MYTED|nr:unnamed protein product [Mytilus edulis]